MSSCVKLIHHQQKKGEHVDIKLQSGRKSISVHSVILKIGSPFLSSLLQSTCFCSRPNTLIINPVYSQVCLTLFPFCTLGALGTLPRIIQAYCRVCLTSLAIKVVSSQILIQAQMMKLETQPNRI